MEIEYKSNKQRDDVKEKPQDPFVVLKKELDDEDKILQLLDTNPEKHPTLRSLHCDTPGFREQVINDLKMRHKARLAQISQDLDTLRLKK